jgi:MFS family permease
MTSENADRGGATAYAWYIAVLLGLAQLVSVLDRYVLGVVTEPLRKSLAISDAQLGFLLGPSFSLLYAVFCLPCGRIADVASRRWLIFGGIAVWTLAAAYSGLAHSFGELLVARLFVGLGEAALVPAAMSLITAYFPPDRLYRAVSVFSSGASLGRATAFLGGGALLSLFTVWGGVTFPFAGHVAPWQALLLCAAGCGVLIALLALTIREPPRLRVEAPPTLRATLDHFWGKRGQYLALFITFSMAMWSTLVLAAWAVSFFVREHGMKPGQASAYLGACSLIIGPSGALFGGWLADQLYLRRLKAPYLVAIMICLGLTPVFAFCFWRAPTIPTALASYVAMYFLISATGGPGYGGVQSLTPDRFRGMMSSLLVVFTSLIGGMGPFLVGTLSDYLFKSERMLGPSILLASLISAAIALGVGSWGIHLARRRAADPVAVSA